MSHDLDWYVRTMGRMSRAELATRLATPLLVETGAQVGSAERSFRTEFVDPTDVKRAPVASTRQVLEVKKKSGGLFSGHIGVGRTPNLDICIPRQGISKFHAYFSAGADGIFQLIDKDSRNGTFVENVRLVPGVPTVVQSGAEIRFAVHSFRFMTQDAFYDFLQEQA